MAPLLLVRAGEGASLLALVQAALIAAVICCVCLKAWGLYDTSRLHDLPYRPARLLGALLCGVLPVAGLGSAPLPHQPGPWTWLAASFVLLVAGRVLARAALARLTAAGRFDERVAVFGAGPIARRVHDHLANAGLGIHFVGVYDDRSPGGRLDPDGLALAGRLDDLIRHAREDRIDRIVIALPQTAERRMAEIAKRLEPLPVSIHVVTHMSCDLVGAHAAHTVSNLGSVGLLDVKKKPLADWDPLLKRLEDYGLGALTLLACAALFPVIALAIKLDSPGPVFFRQRRRGFNLEVFEVFKFRTMRVLEDGSVVRQCAKGDPRVTRIGRLLRRTSLDELPQLINVLRGEMSLVGPRPHALAHDDEFGERSELYALRHQVRPGLTGLAQVNGFRGETASEASLAGRVEQDVLYVRTWSLWLDMKILAQTFWVVATGRNAH
jgi:putative colanic acid biosynthesis UDP-glucose lipid carrier transferase